MHSINVSEYSDTLFIQLFSIENHSWKLNIPQINLVSRLLKWIFMQDLYEWNTYNLDFEKIWYEDSCLIIIFKINEVLIF